MQQIAYFVYDVHIHKSLKWQRQEPKNNAWAVSVPLMFFIIVLIMLFRISPNLNSVFIKFLIFKHESLNFLKQVRYYYCFLNRKNESKKDEVTYWWSYNVNHGICLARGSLSVSHTWQSDALLSSTDFKELSIFLDRPVE